MIHVSELKRYILPRKTNENNNARLSVTGTKRVNDEVELQDEGEGDTIEGRTLRSGRVRAIALAREVAPERRTRESRRRYVQCEHRGVHAASGGQRTEQRERRSSTGGPKPGFSSRGWSPPVSAATDGGALLAHGQGAQIHHVESHHSDERANIYIWLETYVLPTDVHEEVWRDFIRLFLNFYTEQFPSNLLSSHNFLGNN